MKNTHRLKLDAIDLSSGSELEPEEEEEEDGPEEDVEEEDEEDEEDGAEGIRGSKILVGDYNRLRFSLNKGNNDDATHGGHARHRNETEKLKEGVI